MMRFAIPLCFVFSICTANTPDPVQACVNQFTHGSKLAWDNLSQQVKQNIILACTVNSSIDNKPQLTKCSISLNASPAEQAKVDADPDCK